MLDELGVQWVHLAATGLDRLPASLLRRRLVTYSRGAFAGPIAEYVLAAILGFVKGIPDRNDSAGAISGIAGPRASLAGQLLECLVGRYRFRCRRPARAV